MTDIQRFYKDKVVFMTGGTGFLGKVLIEKLLRTTDVACVYILVRPKRGKEISERMADIFNDPLFEKVRRSKNDATLQRVRAIAGDCTLENLGISAADRSLLIQNVEIVIHGAATVRFNEPLDIAIGINVGGTRDVLQLATQMLKLQSFAHISTAFANCARDRTHIEEKFYADKLLVSAEDAWKALSEFKKDKTKSFKTELYSGFPNTYCLTKALSEEAVMRQGSSLPICIVRPSIINTTASEPVPGWTDNFCGAIGTWYAINSGVVRVLNMRMTVVAPLVPVDFCVNSILACVWRTAKTHPPATPIIYNFVPEQCNALTWHDFCYYITLNNEEAPLSSIFWYPFIIGVSSNALYRIVRFMLHTIPGYAIDLGSTLCGKQRSLIKIYEKVHKQSELFGLFIKHQWTFSTNNTKQLWKSLSLEDQRLFNFDMQSIDWKQYLTAAAHGMRLYLLKADPVTIPAAKKLLRRLYILHRTIILLFYTCVVLALLILFNFIFH